MAGTSVPFISHDDKMSLLDLESYTDLLDFGDLGTGWSPVATPGRAAGRGTAPRVCEAPNNAAGGFPTLPHRLGFASSAECPVMQDQSNHSSNMDFETPLGTAESDFYSAMVSSSPGLSVSSHRPAVPQAEETYNRAPPVISSGHFGGSVVIKDEVMGGMRYCIKSTAPRPAHSSLHSFADVPKPRNGATTTAARPAGAPHLMDHQRQSECGENDLFAAFVRSGQSAGISMESLLPDVISGLQALEQEEATLAAALSPKPNTVAELHQSLSMNALGGVETPASVGQTVKKAVAAKGGSGEIQSRMPRRSYSAAGPGTNRPPKEGSVSAKMPKEKLGRKRAAARRYYHNQKNKVYEYEEVVKALEDENIALAAELRNALKKLGTLKQMGTFLEG